MLFDVTDNPHDGSSSPFIGTAQSFLCGGIGAPADIMASPGYHASVKNAPQAKRISGFPTATCDSAARLIRALRLRDLLAAVEEWRRASGPDRVWWRRDARHRLAEWRRLYAIPERAAFQAAVARSRERREEMPNPTERPQVTAPGMVPRGRFIRKWSAYL